MALQADIAGNLTYFADHVEFPAAASGETLGRWPNARGGLYPMNQITLGYANSGPRVGPVVFSEVNYHPGTMPNEDDLEFVEIYNPGSEAVDLDELADPRRHRLRFRCRA